MDKRSPFSLPGTQFKGEQHQTRRRPYSIRRCEKPVQDQLRVPQCWDIPVLQHDGSPALTGSADGNAGSLEWSLDLRQHCLQLFPNSIYRLYFTDIGQYYDLQMLPCVQMLN